MKDLGKKWKQYRDWSIEDLRQGNVPFDGSSHDKALILYGFLNWLAEGCPELD